MTCWHTTFNSKAWSDCQSSRCSRQFIYQSIQAPDNWNAKTDIMLCQYSVRKETMAYGLASAVSISSAFKKGSAFDCDLKIAIDDDGVPKLVGLSTPHECTKRYLEILMHEYVAQQYSMLLFYIDSSANGPWQNWLLKVIANSHSTNQWQKIFSNILIPNIYQTTLKCVMPGAWNKSNLYCFLNILPKDSDHTLYLMFFNSKLPSSGGPGIQHAMKRMIVMTHIHHLVLMLKMEIIPEILPMLIQELLSNRLPIENINLLLHQLPIIGLHSWLTNKAVSNSIRHCQFSHDHPVPI